MVKPQLRSIAYMLRELLRSQRLGSTTSRRDPGTVTSRSGCSRFISAPSKLLHPSNGPFIMMRGMICASIRDAEIRRDSGESSCRRSAHCRVSHKELHPREVGQTRTIALLCRPTRHISSYISATTERSGKCYRIPDPPRRRTMVECDIRPARENGAGITHAVALEE